MLSYLERHTARDWADSFMAALARPDPPSVVDDLGFGAAEAAGTVTHSTH
jgi:hypothetical protein